VLHYHHPRIETIRLPKEHIQHEFLTRNWLLIDSGTNTKHLFSARRMGFSALVATFPRVIYDREDIKYL
jgi:hypothetical protein